MKKALFSPVFFKFSNYHLFDNLESGKINECFGKTSGKKYWILDPKIYTIPVYSLVDCLSYFNDRYAFQYLICKWESICCDIYDVQ